MTYYVVSYAAIDATHMSEPVEADTTKEAVETVLGRNEFFANVPEDVEFKVYELGESETIDKAGLLIQ